MNGKESHIGPNGPELIDGSITPDALNDVITAAGTQGQFISMSQENDLIFIRQGRSMGNGQAALELHNETWKRIMLLPTRIITSTQDNEDTEVKIYPNPANFKLYIEGIKNCNQDTYIEIKDINGKSVFTTEMHEEINLSNMVGGLYHLLIYQGDGEILLNQRFFKK